MHVYIIMLYIFFNDLSLTTVYILEVKNKTTIILYFISNERFLDISCYFIWGLHISHHQY